MFEKYFRRTNIKKIHEEIQNNTIKYYNDIIAVMEQIYDFYDKHADDRTRENIPVYTTQEISKCSPKNAFDISTKIVLNEAPFDSDLRYKYAYYNHRKEPTALVDLDILRMRLEADGFRVKFEYDINSPRGNGNFDAMVVSMLYKDLGEFLNIESQKTR